MSITLLSVYTQLYEWEEAVTNYAIFRMCYTMNIIIVSQESVELYLN